ncbi:alpha/beta hydrolase [Pedobacter frigiditerrae]|uniref:Alpha/beta hydrolase n=1 Tax=Pedobacter frigiditerrae TaxID=2530452 RepID=A0A4R0MP46_9SPHI|nr:alpha/beta hydrolase [Pedobacter frigiditerrae]TCC88601.1 alpha/beta hydrolase [Pedobacter frigiditerrae]
MMYKGKMMIKGMCMSTLGMVLLFSFLNCWAQVIKPVEGNHGIKRGIKVYQNLRYGSQPETLEKDTSSDRTLDLYIPDKVSGAKLPVILFIHGGGFVNGDKSGTKDICTNIAEQGFAIISINYRLSLKGKNIKGSGASSNMAAGLPVDGKFHPALDHAVITASEDAQLALSWIKKQAKTYRFDTRKVVISGGSAGGMTALYTAYISDQEILPIAAVVNLWGGLENATLVAKNAPPVITFHGDKDELINVAYAHALQKAMVQNGDQLSELHIMEGKGHARYDIIARQKIPEIAAFLNKVLNNK